MLRHTSGCLEGPHTLIPTDWQETSDTRDPLPGDRRADAMSDEQAPEPEIRWELVERVRREIEAGVYETPEKWATALGRLVDQLEQG